MPICYVSLLLVGTLQHQRNAFIHYALICEGYGKLNCSVISGAIPEFAWVAGRKNSAHAISEIDTFTSPYIAWRG
jgi:hypothetical protein